MSNVQPSPNSVPRFRCQGLQAPERGLLTALARAIEAYAVPLTDTSLGTGITAIYDNLLFGTDPNLDGYVIIRGRSRWGGFGVRVDQGGNALQVTAYRTDNDGCRHNLGSVGTVLQCRDFRVVYRHPAAYPEILQLITETAATPCGVYVCTASRGCPKARESV